MKYEEQYKKAQADKTVESVTPKFKEFREKGEVIIGEFISSAEVDSTEGGDKYNQYLFKTDEGLIKFSLGSATDKEVAAVLTPQKLYRIESLGQIKISGKRTVNKFDIVEFPADSEPVGDEDEDIAFGPGVK